MSKTEESLVLTGPAELLRIAVSQNADIDKLTKLMDLQERWERNEARKAFVEAMNKFKLTPPAIRKNKHVHFDTQKGPNDYDHATLDHVCDQIGEGLSKVGISYNWKVDQSDSTWIKVTCVLTHSLGYSEETSLRGTSDQTGSKNAIQAIGSTVTYLQRYTLLAATGLAAKNTDNDAHLPQGGEVPEERFVECIDYIANAGDLNELQRVYKLAYKEADEANDKAAQEQYIAAKDKRKRELNASR